MIKIGHNQTESSFTIAQNRRSRSSRMGVHDDQNTHYDLMNLENIKLEYNDKINNILKLCRVIVGPHAQVILWHREVDAFRQIIPNDRKNIVFNLNSDNIISRCVKSKHTEVYQPDNPLLKQTIGEKLDLSGKTLRTYPIILQDQVVSVLGVVLQKKATFLEVHDEQLVELAGLAATVIENLVVKRISEKSLSLTKALKSVTNVHQVMELIVNAACTLTDADSSLIFLYDQKTKLLSLGARTDEHTDSDRPSDDGLEQHILFKAPVFHTGHASKNPIADKACGKKKCQSFIGIRLESGEKKLGVFYVRKKEKYYFIQHHVDVLVSLAAQVSSALEGSYFFFKSSFDIQDATSRIYDAESLFKNITQKIKKKWDADSVSIQLIRHGGKFIETVYLDPPENCTVLQKLSSAVKSSLNDKSIPDMHAHIVSTVTNIEIISGWYEKFDRWRYKLNRQADYVRIWLPIITICNEDGEVSDICHTSCEHQQTNEDLDDSETDETGHRTTIELMIPNVENYKAEVIGTIEVLFNKKNKTFLEDKIRSSVELLRDICKYTKDIRKTQLPYVLETITRQAKNMLNADSASFHYPFHPGKNAPSITRVGAGTNVRNLMDHQTPRPKGLGYQAIKDRKPYFSSGDALRKDNPNVYATGIQSMGAFPLTAETLKGILYVHFKSKRLFTQYEIEWAKLFTHQAVNAIKKATNHIETRDHRRILNNLHEIDRLLMETPKDEDLLQIIAGISRNVVGADLVSIYVNDNLTEPTRSGKFISKPHREYDPLSPIHLLLDEDQPVYEQNHKKPSYQHIFAHQNRTIESTIDLENIQATAGLQLKIGSESFGVLFVNYRYPHNFRKDEKAVIEMFASAVSSAIKTKRTYQHLARRNQELQALKTIDHEIANHKYANIDHILKKILEFGTNITKANDGSIYWYNKARDLLELKNEKSNVGAQEIKEIRPGQGVIGLSAQKKIPILITDINQPPWRDIYLADLPGMRSELAVPLVDNNGLRGVINVEHRDVNFFRQDEKDLLSTFADKALIAIHSVENLEKLAQHYKSLNALSDIALKILDREHTLNIVLSYILTGITASYGLGFSRAMLFFYDKSNTQLTGQMAIGAQTRVQAEANWTQIVNLRPKTETSEKKQFGVLLDEAERFRRAVDTGNQLDTKLSTEIKAVKFNKRSFQGAMETCICKQIVSTVSYDQTDAFRKVIQTIYDPDDKGAAFVCVPIISARGTTLGVLVADNRFLINEREADFDEAGLTAYANIATMAVENKRLEEKLANEQKIASTKESIEKMMHVIGERVSSLDETVNNLNSEMAQLNGTTPGLVALGQTVWEIASSIKDDINKFKLFGSDLTIRKWPIGLNHLLYALQQSYGELIEYQDTTNEPLTLYGDEQYIKDAFIELISNAKDAMKACDTPKIFITLSIHSNLSTEPHIEIDFLDVGPGIDQKEKFLIFDPYYTRKSKHGLGLTIVRDIIEAHGGKIKEVGGKNKGAKFVIKLPTTQVDLAKMSPYTVSGGITEASIFFGREQILSDIYHNPGNYFLVGARQMGKTSLLRAIERHYRTQPNISCHYVELSGPELLSTLARALKLSDPSYVISFLHNAIDGQRRLLLIDEADMFVRAEVDHDYTTLKALRALSEQGACHFIFAGFWELYQCTSLDYHSPINNFGEVLTLDALEHKACVQLATKPMAVMNIHYASEHIVSRMVEETGHRPNLIATLCNEILKTLDPLNKTIQTEHMETAKESDAITRALSAWGHMNGKIHAANRLDRIIVYLTVAQPSFAQNDLFTKIQQLNLPYEPEAIKASLTRLQLAYILRLNKDRYDYCVPLFREKRLAENPDVLLRGEVDELKRNNKDIHE